MVTYEDCLALADLTAEEVERIAAHEHLPPIVAVGLCSHRSGPARSQPRVVGVRRTVVLPLAISTPASKPATNRLAA